MSHFAEIKDLLTNEIVNSPQYQIALKIKNLIIADILQPNINLSFIYNFEDSDYIDNIDINKKDYDEQIIMFSLKLILGFDVILIQNGSDRGIIIDMKKFLE